MSLFKSKGLLLNKECSCSAVGKQVSILIYRLHNHIPLSGSKDTTKVKVRLLVDWSGKASIWIFFCRPKLDRLNQGKMAKVPLCQKQKFTVKLGKGASWNMDVVASAVLWELGILFLVIKEEHKSFFLLPNMTLARVKFNSGLCWSSKQGYAEHQVLPHANRNVMRFDLNWSCVNQATVEVYLMPMQICWMLSRFTRCIPQNHKRLSVVKSLWCQGDKRTLK